VSSPRNTRYFLAINLVVTKAILLCEAFAETPTGRYAETISLAGLFIPIHNVGVWSFDHRRQFASDNNAGCCPEVFAALQNSSPGHVAGYGSDEITGKANDAFRSLFETDCATFFVFNGTAANSLAVGSFCSPHHSVLCHRHSHIESDECNAPGFLNQGLRIATVDGANGKIELANLREALRGRRDFHASQPRVVSLTNTTELGTLYRPNEIAELAEFARSNRLAVHVDGARFANAVASVGCTPAELTWKAGVDVLVFGGTKNGLAFGEAVVFFNNRDAADFMYRMKQSGQLASKMRFLAAQWLGLLADGKWLEYAAHANAMAERLYLQLSQVEVVNLLFPREGNAVFVKIPDPIVARLRELGWRFYTDVGPGGGARLMCSWDTTEQDVDRFTLDLRGAL
jgi:threonine aldolase